mgnify:CR=1 FL=1
MIRNDWWSTPVWEIQTPFDEEFNNQLLIEFEEYTGPRNNLTYNIWKASGKNIAILNEYTCKVVKEACAEFIRPIYGDSDFEHKRGWVNYNPPGQGIPVHCHGTPQIAMTYYVKTPEKCGDLLLIDPRGGAIGWDMGMDTVSGSKFNRIKPKESKLVFFPAFVLHSVETNRSSNYRISLSSNMGTK